MKVDELWCEWMNGDSSQIPTSGLERVRRVAALAECYATGTPHPDGKKEYGGRLDRLTFNALVRKALGIAEPEKPLESVVDSGLLGHTPVDDGEHIGGGSDKAYQIMSAELARLREVERAARFYRNVMKEYGAFRADYKTVVAARCELDSLLNSALSIGEKEGGQ